MRVRVRIIGKDRNVGAMVKALAVEVSGFQAVKGTTKEFLARNGFYDFDFPTADRAVQFTCALSHYLPHAAEIVDD